MQRLGTARAAAPPAATDVVDLADIERRFEEIARRVSPAVVAISGSDEHFENEATQRKEDLNPDKLGRALDAVDRTVGTGLVIDPDGYILTNDHVVGRSAQLWVTTDDRRVYPAIIVGSDPRSDLAVLKIPARDLPTVRFAEPGKVRRGQWSIAIGSPYGLSSEGEMCMSVGIVSATGRSLPKLSGKEDRLYSNLIQTTAQINPGNSGGPLFNLNGEVIGINTAVILPQKQTNGIGFAIPVTTRLLETVSAIKEGREIVYGYLGARVSTPSERERRESGVEGEYGAYVDFVEPSSPGEAAGLKKGDIIVRVGTELVLDGEHFVRAIGAAPVETPVAVRLHRGRQVMAVKATLRRRNLPSQAVTRDTRRFRWRGMLLGPVPANWQSPDGRKVQAGLMVIGVEPHSPMLKLGVRAGSVITSVAGRAITDVTELQKIVNDTPPDRCCGVKIADQREVVVSVDAQ